MPYSELEGNLFDSKSQTLVNTVNCVGVMGKGIALEFRRRFPEMFEAYKKVCLKNELQPGQILPYKKSIPWILNFAIKTDWKQPSKLLWVETCLEKFSRHYRELEIESVAFPWMGAMNGRIPFEEIQAVMRKYLKNIDDIDIEVYTFDSNASDPLFRTLEKLIHDLDIELFSKESTIRKDKVQAIYTSVLRRQACSMSSLVDSDIIGQTTSDKLYSYLVQGQNRINDQFTPGQQQLLFK